MDAITRYDSDICKINDIINDVIIKADNFIEFFLRRFKSLDSNYVKIKLFFESIKLQITISLLWIQKELYIYRIL